METIPPFRSSDKLRTKEFSLTAGFALVPVVSFAFGLLVPSRSNFRPSRRTPAACTEPMMGLYEDRNTWRSHGACIVLLPFALHRARVGNSSQWTWQKSRVGWGEWSSHLRSAGFAQTNQRNSPMFAVELASSGCLRSGWWKRAGAMQWLSSLSSS